jgi:hypothetical protein
VQTSRNLSRTLFLSIFLLTIMAVFLFPGRIQASKYSVTNDPLSQSGERAGKRLWNSQPQLDSNGGLSESADWSAGSEEANAFFGFSVGLAGDVNGDGISDVIVGAFGENKVYVYYGTDSVEGMSTAADWEASGPAGFGCSVGTAGDVNGDGYSDVIVGAYNVDKAYVFYGSVDGLPMEPGENIATPESAAWAAESDRSGSYFGRSVGTAGDVNNDGYSDVIVGAYLEEKAYVFHGSKDGLSVSADWTAESDQPGAYFGFSVGTAGDVNNDGISDIIVGTYFEGKAYVFHGSVDGLPVDPVKNIATHDNAAWTAESDHPDAYFGRSVGTAGDVNNDGYSDVIVGAYGESRAYVFHGSDSDAGLSMTADWEVSGEADSNFGVSVGTAGDVNDDGFSDVIVGAYGEGKAYVFHGSDSVEGMSTTADWSAESEQAEAWFGISVGAAGDVNGDEISDVIVGARMYKNSETTDDNGGRAFVYYGSSDAICFIATVAYGSSMKPQIGFVATMALTFFFVAGLIGFMEFRKVKK